MFQILSEGFQECFRQEALRRVMEFQGEVLKTSSVVLGKTLQIYYRVSLGVSRAFQGYSRRFKGFRVVFEAFQSFQRACRSLKGHFQAVQIHFRRSCLNPFQLDSGFQMLLEASSCFTSVLLIFGDFKDVSKSFTTHFRGLLSTFQNVSWGVMKILVSFLGVS